MSVAEGLIKYIYVDLAACFESLPGWKTQSVSYLYFNDLWDC